MEAGNKKQQIIYRRCPAIIKNNKTANEAKIDDEEEGDAQPNRQQTLKVYSPPKNHNQRKTPKSRSKNKKTIWAKGIDCLKHLYYKCLCPREEKIYLIIKEKDLLRSIDNLRKDNNINSFYLPAPRENNKKTLVIDLEGVLLDTSRHRFKNYDFAVYYEHRAKETKVYCKKRPGVHTFLEDMAKIYEIVLFTSCQKQYANGILDNISKPGQIQHRLYRQKCLNLNLIYYLKEMRRLNRDPSKVVFIDCNVATGVLQPLNFHMIKRYHHNLKDEELTNAGYFLKWLAEKEQVTPVFKNYEQYIHEQDCFQQDAERPQTYSSPDHFNLNLSRTNCRQNQHIIESSAEPKQGGNYPDHFPDLPQVHIKMNENQQATTQSSLVHVDCQPQKNIKIEKIVASKNIFSKIERTLANLEASQSVSKPEPAICREVQGEKGRDWKEKHQRVSSQTPLVRIMKKILRDEMINSQKIIRTVS